MYFIYKNTNEKILSDARFLYIQNNETSHNIWGLDLDGTLQGTVGVGGLLAVVYDNTTYLPTYDANGNISEYLTTNGTVVAHYDYSPFGETLISSFPLANTFTHQFSTKPYCPVTRLCEYQMRKYSPSLGRWLTRNLIEEEGGVNMYATCGNNVCDNIDFLGQYSIKDLIYSNIGVDFAKDLLGPFGKPTPIAGARLQIFFYVSFELSNCTYKCKKKPYYKITGGIEPYLIWGYGQKRTIKGKERNKPDGFRPGKKKKYSTDPQRSGFRTRELHMGIALENNECPQKGFDYSMSGAIFLRGSAGLGSGV